MQQQPFAQQQGHNNSQQPQSNAVKSKLYSHNELDAVDEMEKVRLEQC